MFTPKAIKIISIALSVIGAAAGIATEFIGKKELDVKVAKAVEKALAARN